MADIKLKYATHAAMTITLASLANGSARQSTEIDNSSDLYIDALVQVKVKTNSSGVNSYGSIAIYVYASVDDGTTRAGGAGATDNAITFENPPNLTFIGTMTANANNTTYISSPFSVAAAFGGILPERWGVALKNLTGAALSATGSDHSVQFQGIHQQVV